MRAGLSADSLYAENQQPFSKFLAEDHASKIIDAVAHAYDGHGVKHNKWKIEHALVFAMPERTRTTFVMLGSGQEVPKKTNWNNEKAPAGIMKNSKTDARFLNDPVLKVLLLRREHEGLTQ